MSSKKGSRSEENCCVTAAFIWNLLPSSMVWMINRGNYLPETVRRRQNGKSDCKNCRSSGSGGRRNGAGRQKEKIDLSVSLLLFLAAVNVTSFFSLKDNRIVVVMILTVYFLLYAGAKELLRRRAEKKRK